jgi:hypothetical protein
LEEFLGEETPDWIIERQEGGGHQKCSVWGPWEVKNFRQGIGIRVRATRSSETKYIALEDQEENLSVII